MDQDKAIKIVSNITAEVIKQILPILIEMENKSSISFHEALKQVEISQYKHSS